MNLPQAKRRPRRESRPQIWGLDSLRGLCFGWEENSIYCWRDLNRLQKDVAFLEDDFS